MSLLANLGKSAIQFMLTLLFYFHQEITKVGDELGIVPVIIRGEELNQRGFGGKFVVIAEVLL